MFGTSFQSNSLTEMYDMGERDIAWFWTASKFVFLGIVNHQKFYVTQVSRIDDVMISILQESWPNGRQGSSHLCRLLLYIVTYSTLLYTTYIDGPHGAASWGISSTNLCSSFIIIKDGFTPPPPPPPPQKKIICIFQKRYFYYNIL